jgi:hypothetical protein
LGWEAVGDWYVQKGIGDKMVISIVILVVVLAIVALLVSGLKNDAAQGG